MIFLATQRLNMRWTAGVKSRLGVASMSRRAILLSTPSNQKPRIFSSGSALAQRLLFANTEVGDLSRFLDGYFDTNIGSKTDQESYRKIANQFHLPVAEMLFISDMTAELDAAKRAGMQTLLCVRPGNLPQPEKHTHGVISSFSEIVG